MGRDGRGVRAVSESSIEITFMYRGVRCRERISLKPTATNLKRAEQHKAAVEHAIANGTFEYAVTFPGSPRAAKFAPEASQETVAGFLTKWLAGKKQHVSSSTFEGYRKLVELRLVPALGPTLLVELKRKTVRDWLNTLEVSNKTLSNIQSCLRSALNDAVDNDELIDTNPLAGWTFSRKDQVKEDDVDPFSPEEQRAILAALDGQARNLVQFALWTGMRTSELVALDWGDIDWLKGEVYVTRAMTQAAAGEAEVTKTLSGKRRIKLLAPAMEALTAQKAHTFLAGNEVFQNPRTMERWKGDQPIRKTMWAHAVKKAGVRYRRPYQTRHTYASMMLSAGEHPMWVAGQMGHSDWTMIARVYGRWMPSADESAGSKALSYWSEDKESEEIREADLKKRR
ncbi:site-specific integrase [Pseudomonas aeruginosa]|nr:site-specific integrase [Pseudomonas aeruginosa]ELH7262733.1 site-specific integrase [Pseudomonas aeruginosa]ELL1153984.1 site-specific integrase [Pseudomonas aeruginosa]HBP0149602.1 site-specific integrase [Pseudomonas aeruginosa]HBP6641698.1 site-specific integrase [Pseudomonas aeruginosa]